jgi:hypothetical protein
MLGIALNAQRAGWAIGDPFFLSNSPVSVTAYNGWSGFVSFTPNTISSPQGGDNLSSSFNNSGTVSGNKALFVQTVKWADMSNFTWLTDGFRSGYQTIDAQSAGGTLTLTFMQPILDNKTTVQNMGLLPGRTVTGNRVSFLVQSGTYEFADMGVTWDSLADTWLTIVHAGSSASTDFANYTGSLSGGVDYYTRTTISDARTGALLAQKDLSVLQFNAMFTNYASLSFDYRTDASGAGTAYIYQTIQAGDLVNGSTDMLFGAGWFAAGQTLDPLATDANGTQWRQYWLGQNFPQTVNSIDAWINWSAKDVVTNGVDQDYTIMQAGRVSTGSNLLVKNPTSTLTSPYEDASRPGD